MCKILIWIDNGSIHDQLDGMKRLYLREFPLEAGE